MRKFALPIVLVLAWSITPADAAERPRYRGIAMDPNSTYFLDVASVRMRGGALTGWIATEEASPFEGALSTHFLLAVNCETEEFWFPTSIYYSANGLQGQVVKSISRGDKAQRGYAPPDSLAQIWIQAICGLNAKKNPALVDSIQSAELSRRAALRFYADEKSALASAIYPNIR